MPPLEPTAQQRQNAIQAAGVTPVASTTPPVYNTTNLTPTTPLTLPQAPQVTSGQEMLGSINGGVSSIESILAGLQAPTGAEKTQDELRSGILSTLDTLAGKTARTQALEEQKGLPGMQTQLRDVANQLQALQKEAQAVPLQIQEEFAGRGTTLGGVEPIQASRLRQNAIKSLTLASIGQTLQGNIALAQSQVDRAVNLEFEPQEKRLDYLKQIYDFNREDLQRTDKKRADQINILLGERERVLNQQKEDKKNILNVSLEAARSGADATTLESIRNSVTPDEAIAKAGGFLGAEFREKQKQQKFENEIKQRNLAINEAQLRLQKDEFAFKKQQAQADVSSGVLTDAEIKNIDASPQGKQVQSLGTLKTKLDAYKQLVKTYGTASAGTQKSILNAAYSDLKIAYKNAAELGAIQAPDVPLIEGALANATFSNPLSQIFRKVTGSGRVGTIEAGLDQASKAIQSSADVVVPQLLARNPKYQNSNYVQSLVLPLLEAEQPVIRIQDQPVSVGAIITNEQGKRGRVNSDGTITPL